MNVFDNIITIFVSHTKTKQDEYSRKLLHKRSRNIIS